MGDLSFQNLPSETHHCTSHREGEWITWRCPHCQDYERRLNWATGEMQVRRGDSEANHVGVSTKERNMEALTRMSFHN
jgi:hypothetical protein